LGKRIERRKEADSEEMKEIGYKEKEQSTKRKINKKMNTTQIASPCTQ
jgi:hypothetical protein